MLVGVLMVGIGGVASSLPVYMREKREGIWVLLGFFIILVSIGGLLVLEP